MYNLFIYILVFMFYMSYIVHLNILEKAEKAPFYNGKQKRNIAKFKQVKPLYLTMIIVARLQA